MTTVLGGIAVRQTWTVSDAALPPWERFAIYAANPKPGIYSFSFAAFTERDYGSIAYACGGGRSHSGIWIHPRIQDFFREYHPGGGVG